MKAILLITSILFSINVFASDLRKIAVSNYAVATILYEHILTTECRIKIGTRNADWSNAFAALELGRPYMTSAELNQLSSGSMLRDLRQDAKQQFEEIMNRQLVSFKGNENEKCQFVLGYAAGQKMASKLMLKN